VGTSGVPVSHSRNEPQSYRIVLGREKGKKKKERKERKRETHSMHGKTNGVEK